MFSESRENITIWSHLNVQKKKKRKKKKKTGKIDRQVSKSHIYLQI